MNPYESPAVCEDREPSSRPLWLAAYVLMVFAYCFLLFFFVSLVMTNFNAIIATGALCLGCVVASLMFANHAFSVGCRDIQNRCKEIKEICDRMIRRIVANEVAYQIAHHRAVAEGEAARLGDF